MLLPLTAPSASSSTLTHQLFFPLLKLKSFTYSTFSSSLSPVSLLQEVQNYPSVFSLSIFLLNNSIITLALLTVHTLKVPALFHSVTSSTQPSLQHQACFSSNISNLKKKDKKSTFSIFPIPLKISSSFSSMPFYTSRSLYYFKGVWKMTGIPYHQDLLPSFQSWATHCISFPCHQ